MVCTTTRSNVQGQQLVASTASLLSAANLWNDDDKNLVRLADETGGRVEYPLQNVYSDVAGYLSTPSDDGNYAYRFGTGGYASALAKGMYKAVEAVAGEVTTQYIIRYTPDSTDEKKQFRNIVVKVSLGNVKVRARKGYYPFAP